MAFTAARVSAVSLAWTAAADAAAAAPCASVAEDDVVVADDARLGESELGVAAATRGEREEMGHRRDMPLSGDEKWRKEEADGIGNGGSTKWMGRVRSSIGK